MTKPGWYDDPQDPTFYRYWDGEKWTATTSPKYSTPNPVTQPEPSVSARSTPSPVPAKPVVKSPQKVGLFGAKRVANEMSERAEQLAKEAAQLTVRVRELEAEKALAESELTSARALMNELGAVPVERLSREIEAIENALIERRSELRARLDAVDREVEERRAAAFTAHQQVEQDLATRTQVLNDQAAAAYSRLIELQACVARTEDAEVLQEVGIYEYRHPLQGVEDYKVALTQLRAQIKQAAKKDGGAVSAVSGWQVNGSVREGKKMVDQTSKLMLRAYNLEADDLVRRMRPYRLSAAIDKLNKSVTMIEKLGVVMQIKINPGYHALRVRELELVADHQEKLAEEKERQREERERMREEAKAAAEVDKERQRLARQRQQHQEAMEKLRERGDTAGVAEMEARCVELDEAIEQVDQRAHNNRLGHVYVISNVGAFGPGVVKIGMTRRMDPMDRVNELGDASVPFRFDVHALVFTSDAVGLENALHRRFAAQRVNRVNMRREFFYTTPQDVHAALSELRDEIPDLQHRIVEFNEDFEAVEYHQSENIRRGGAAT